MAETPLLATQVESSVVYGDGGVIEHHQASFLKVFHAFRDRDLRELKGAPLSVLLCIGLHLNAVREAWPSLKKIAEETGYDRTSVVRALKVLEARGYIERMPRFSEDGGCDSTLYRMKAPNVAENNRGGLDMLPPSGVHAPTPSGVHAPTPGAQITHEVDTSKVERGSSPSNDEGEDARSSEGPQEKSPNGNERLFGVMRAVADVAGVDLEANRGQLQREAKQLAALGATPEEIRRHFGPGGWWFRADWRGRKGERPGVADVRKAWGRWTVAKLVEEPHPAKATGPWIDG